MIASRRPLTWADVRNRRSVAEIDSIVADAEWWGVEIAAAIAGVSVAKVEEWVRMTNGKTIVVSDDAGNGAYVRCGDRRGAR